jgi:hypothetical protein
MIDEFRRGASLGAERLSGRVSRVWFQAGEATIFDYSDRAAPGNAEPAIAVNALHADMMIGHHVSLPVLMRMPLHHRGWAGGPDPDSVTAYSNSFWRTTVQVFVRIGSGK